jgi:hypothetical protein
LPRKHYRTLVDIAICRLTAEWRLLLEDADDDPRGEAA